LTLLQGINGGVEDLKNYDHCLQECASPTLAPADDLSPQKSIKDESSIGVMLRLDQKLAKEKEHNDELEAQCIALKDENEIAAATTERGSRGLTHTNLTNDARAENKASKGAERRNKESCVEQTSGRCWKSAQCLLREWGRINDALFRWSRQATLP
jgi:hypothetical protein